MLYSEEFIIELRNDPINGVIKLIDIARENLIDDPENWHDHDHQVLTEAIALLMSLIEAELIQVPYAIPKITGNIKDDCVEINRLLGSIKEYYLAESSKLRIESLTAHFRMSLSSGFCYEFSQGDLEKVQTLLNELRSQISTSTFFEKEHKQRLLKRLEKLQSELHKKVSDLDKFWGLVGDAGVALGKFGKDAKPLVDRIREIAQIVWRTQARAEELPSESDFPLISMKKED